MPPYGDLLGPATPSQAPEQPRQPATAMIPAQRAPIEQPEAQDRFNKFKSAEEAAPAPVRSSKVLLLVIGACVALLGLALGSLYFVGNILDPGDSPSFTVGQCVKENSGDAVAAQCSDAGAFSVVQIVDNAEKCPDQNQPTIKQGTEILCLKPAAAEPAAQ